MCLRPHKILNPSRYMQPNSGQPLFILIPCGFCSECIALQRSEWQIRSKYEALGTSNFVYFDTLTYDEVHLPHLSDFLNVPQNVDFPCFSKTDIQLFLKRLRKKLSSCGYSTNFRYFIASEYGSVRYTARPHYHCLFFVNFDIDPCLFSEFVGQSWQNGLTDGLPFKTRSYVQNHNVFNVSDLQSLNRVTNYCSKYCTKDMFYTSLVNKRLERLKNFDFEYYTFAKDFIRCFHLQSKGFGYNSLLRIIPEEKLMLGDGIPVSDSRGLTRYISLPVSLQRKAFCLFSRYPHHQEYKIGLRKRGMSNVYNSPIWYKKSSYVKYKINTSESSIRRYANRLSCGDPNNINYEYAKSLLYYHDHLSNRDCDIVDLIKSSSKPFINGFRNYSSRDKGLFIKTSVFSRVDYGSKSLPSCIPHIISHSDLIDYNVFKTNSLFDDDAENHFLKYQASISAKGDPNLEVLKLTTHLKQLHKHLNLC